MCYESARVAHSNRKYIRISMLASSNYSFTKVPEAQSSNNDIMSKFGQGRRLDAPERRYTFFPGPGSSSSSVIVCSNSIVPGENLSEQRKNQQLT